MWNKETDEMMELVTEVLAVTRSDESQRLCDNEFNRNIVSKQKIH